MSILPNIDENVNNPLTQHIEFIQEQIEFHKAQSTRFEGNSNPYRSAKHLETAQKLREIRDLLLQQQEKLLEAIKVHKRPLLSISPEDLEGLPKEQIEELSITISDKAEFSILAMLETNKGIMSLDQIIVGLYKETGDIQKRSLITARLYRMSQKGMIHSVPTKKGVYSLEEITKEEAELLFKGGTTK